MIQAKISIVGEIDVKEPDDSVNKYPVAMLITFKSVDELRDAMKALQVSLTWDENNA